MKGENIFRGVIGAFEVPAPDSSSLRRDGVLGATLRKSGFTSPPKTSSSVDVGAFFFRVGVVNKLRRDRGVSEVFPPRYTDRSLGGVDDLLIG